MSKQLEDQIKQHIIAILKSSTITLAHQIKQQLVKIDPMTTVRQLLARLKHELNLSPNDSLFLYAYGSILNSEETIGNISDKFKGKIGDGKLELQYAEMASFGNDLDYMQVYQILVALIEWEGQASNTDRISLYKSLISSSYQTRQIQKWNIVQRSHLKC